MTTPAGEVPAPGSTAAEFDAHAAGYQQAVDRSIAFTGRDSAFFARRKARLLGRIAAAHGRPLAASRVLDAGCGTGTFARALAGQVAELTGVDVSEEMLAEARRLVPAARFVGYDGARLPFPDGAFDLAVAVCVLHHVPPAQRPGFVAELLRVVTPGGLVAVLEHNPFNPLTRRAVDRCPLDEGVELVSAGAVADLLHGAGGRVVRRDHIFFSPFGGPVGDAVDRWCRRIPLGAQHLVLAETPRRLRRPAGR